MLKKFFGYVFGGKDTPYSINIQKKYINSFTKTFFNGRFNTLNVEKTKQDKIVFALTLKMVISSSSVWRSKDNCVSLPM